MSSSATDASPASAWTASAYGLDLAGDFPVAGLDASAPSRRLDDLPAVELRRASRTALQAAWPRSGTERISAIRGPAGRPALTISRHPTAGHLLTGVGYGRFHVDADAHTVRCAPVRAPDWRWQRYLLGQVLPFVAGLHGRELLHAGGVVLDGRAVAICGSSGSGKTTVVAHLVAAGAAFLADDTVALQPRRDGAVLAHPGPALAVLRPDAAHAFPADVGTRVGASTDEVCVAVAATSDAVALGVVAFLERGGPGRRPTVERLAGDDPRPLLGAAYDLVRRDPGRLVAQLDVVARVARTATLLRVRVPANAEPRATAEAIAEAVRA